jgi:hypothetical protein
MFQIDGCMMFATGTMKRFVQTTLAMLLFATGTVLSQESNPSSGATDPLRQHFMAAQRAQAAGDLNRAQSEYVAFLSLALRRLGDHRANAGDFKRAVSLFEEALLLTPDDFSLVIRLRRKPQLKRFSTTTPGMHRLISF